MDWSLVIMVWIVIILAILVIILSIIESRLKRKKTKEYEEQHKDEIQKDLNDKLRAANIKTENEEPEINNIEEKEID